VTFLLFVDTNDSKEEKKMGLSPLIHYSQEAGGEPIS